MISIEDDESSFATLVQTTQKRKSAMNLWCEREKPTIENPLISWFNECAAFINCERFEQKTVANKRTRELQHENSMIEKASNNELCNQHQWLMWTVLSINFKWFARWESLQSKWPGQINCPNGDVIYVKAQKPYFDCCRRLRRKTCVKKWHRDVVVAVIWRLV